MFSLDRASDVLVVHVDHRADGSVLYVLVVQMLCNLRTIGLEQQDRSIEAMLEVGGGDRLLWNGNGGKRGMGPRDERAMFQHGRGERAQVCVRDDDRD